MKHYIIAALVWIGLFLVIGAAGGSDTGTPLGQCAVIALIGLIMVISGAILLKRSENDRQRHKRSHPGTAPQTADGSMRKSGRA